MRHLVTTACPALVHKGLFLFVFIISLSLQCHLCGSKCQNTNWRSVLGCNVGCNQTMHPSPTYIIPGELWVVGLLLQMPSALNLPARIWPYAVWRFGDLGHHHHWADPDEDPQDFYRRTRLSTFDKIATTILTGLQPSLNWTASTTQTNRVLPGFTLTLWVSASFPVSLHLL